MSLSPTKIRLRRLAAVAAGKIHRYGDGQSYDNRHYRVSHAMDEMCLAGWVELGVQILPHPCPVGTHGGREETSREAGCRPGGWQWVM